MFHATMPNLKNTNPITTHGNRTDFIRSIIDINIFNFNNETKTLTNLNQYSSIILTKAILSKRFDFFLIKSDASNGVTAPDLISKAFLTNTIFMSKYF
ncbi:hypothetical protein BpHYR1_050481 [Brachionus plicatilis]|uniref:Uncharacterized protein n=1 Tax=Brachionus plicatilis TaxID=10195 RepID=A0A3M7QBZ6_BRAPC|nr:hypothetical protein BpHYR1_050481 [Brachionus plicatilis]